MPERIQRKRTKGWRMPGGAVYVGRPSKWGNPYVVGAVLWAGSVYEPDDEVRDAQHAVDLYRRWLYGSTGGARTGFGPVQSAYVTMGDPRDLAGRDLACWCPLDQPCHADVLLELAEPTPRHDDDQPENHRGDRVTCYAQHWGAPCECDQRLALVVTHTRTSTPLGPDYCAECSGAVSEWMPWPCPSRDDQPETEVAEERK